MRRRTPDVLLLLLVLSLEAAAEDTSRTEINRAVTDPVSLTWSLKLENDISWIEGSDGRRVQDILLFQPSMPVLLTPALKLITRPKFTLLEEKPYTTSQGDPARTTGVGDTVLDLAFSPIAGPWLIGLGPTWIFPTANLDETGQGKWQVGPGGVGGYKSKTWLVGVIAQQWWSFAGSSSRSSVNQLHLQYLASYFFGDGWSVGSSPTITFNWNASAGNSVTFPIGLGLGKVVKIAGELPLKLDIEGQYMPLHPASNGEVFRIELKVTPVIEGLLVGPFVDAR